MTYGIAVQGDTQAVEVRHSDGEQDDVRLVLAVFRRSVDRGWGQIRTAFTTALECRHHRVSRSGLRAAVDRLDGLTSPAPTAPGFGTN